MYIYLDTETTGVDEEDYLCQLAYKTNKDLEVNELFKPPVSIKFGAMATHHITEKMVAGKPAFLNSQTQIDLVTLLQDPGNILVAHNAQFDVGMLKKEGVEAPRVICTLKLIKTLDAEGELESYKLQYLRYCYGMEIEAQAHDAWGDILVLEQLFIRIFKEFQKKFETPQEIVAEMIRISENPVLMAKIPMGKHRGLHFRDVPKDYLQWIVGQDFDEDLLFTAKYYLN